jgi:hypothetical protein
MQPAQLSLLPDQVPPPATDLLAGLPQPQVAAAIADLARLIANAVATASIGEVGGD